MIDALEVYTVSLLTCEGRYLLLQRSLTKSFAPGRWTGLGGKVEADEYEALRAAALREVYEEAGLEAAQIHDFVLRRALLVNRPQAPLRVLLYFTGRLDEAVLPACPEGELAWKEHAEFAALDVIETTRPVLDRLVEDIALDPAGARPPEIGMAYFDPAGAFRGVTWGGGA